MDLDETILPICVCPWCKEVPEFEIHEGSGKTWLIYIRCDQEICKIKPKTFFVPIRNTSKKNAVKIEEKIRCIFGYWNDNNPFPPNHGKVFNFKEIAEKGFPFMESQLYEGNE
jgi:hypothetical protein